MESDLSLIVSVDGGLGDHISAEPSIRYLKEKVFPFANIFIACNYPRIFAHLKIPTYLHNAKELPIEGPSCFKLFSFPTEGPITQAVCFLTCHAVDYHSMSILKRTLPLLDKTYNLSVEEKDRESLKQKLGTENPKNFVLLHAGKSWPSKTFPKEWWQEVANNLSKEGARICLIGKRASDLSGDTTGVVEIDAPKNSIDLRDKLSLGELFALIETAPVLLSNDTSLIQIAGAFENWIVMIASCKHPDLVLPYRHGSPWHKTKALYKRLVIDDIPFEPARDAQIVVDGAVTDWTPYLPDTKTVTKEIISLLK
jgi:hypothetical protein